jgi:CheY-like chemotaxis protein
VQSHLISDLLDFAGIRFGKMRLEQQVVDAPRLVRVAVDTVSHQAIARGIDLTIDVPSGPHAVLGDEARLQQIVWNLLTNAFKFTPTGGRVAVTARAVGRWFEIAVSDTGRGISAEFLPRLFDRFSQQDTSKAKSFAGLGIGLTIVRHLVELHEGTISVASEGEGRGATFTVCLPLAATHVGTGGERPSGALGGIRVLVVEDGEDTRALIVRLLSDAGAVVSEAVSADQALESVERDAPQVLVSDIGMARTDGYALLRTLRQQGWSAERLPAIALTAFVRSQDQAEALEAGFQVHLGKPVNANALIGAIARLTASPPGEKLT